MKGNFAVEKFYTIYLILYKYCNIFNQIKHGYTHQRCIFTYQK